MCFTDHIIIIDIYLFGLNMFLVPHLLVIFFFSPSCLNRNFLILVFWNRLYLVHLIDFIKLNIDVNGLTTKHVSPFLSNVASYVDWTIQISPDFSFFVVVVQPPFDVEPQPLIYPYPETDFGRPLHV